MTSARFAASYCLDLVAGDPRGMPHPVRVMGSAIEFGERGLRRGGNPASEFWRGALLTGAIVTGSWVAGRVVARAGGAVAEVVLGWTALATRSMLDESAAVLDALDRGDLARARTLLARIVGRDTEALDEAEIVRAVIETVAEGLCDGVVAPMLHLAAGGVPLALAYKAANTLDSMIGHPEAPYRYFGRAAARLDDGLNFLPARIAACAVAVAAGVAGGDASAAWRVWRRDGDRHPSPNAGQTEAAMAGALGVRLGGVNYYHGEPSPKPILGAEGRCANRDDARAALRLAGVASVLVFCGAWLCLRRRERTR